MSDKYMVSEVFYSLQGEGHRAGSANVFIRFSGCNLRCDMEVGPLSPGGFACDTEFVSGISMTGPQLINAVKKAKGDARCGWVICTGGEPLLQLNDALISLLHREGFRIAIETNGTQPIPESI